VEEFEKTQRGRCTLLVHKDFRNADFEDALCAGESEVNKRYRLTRVNSSRFARLYRLKVRFNQTDTAVYYKECLFRSAWDYAKHMLRAGRAQRALEGSSILAREGFCVPTVIAAGWCKSGPLCRRSFIVTAEAENTRPIYQLIPESFQQLTTERIREFRSLTKALGRTVGRMHAKGIFHGDLRLGNILAGKDNGGWRFYFLDNERTKKFGRIPDRLRVKNLVQLNLHWRGALTTTDRLRFFKAYLEENPDLKTDAKKWMQRVLKKTEYRLRKKPSLRGD